MTDMNYAELLEGPIDEKGRLISWYDGIVFAVFRGNPPIIFGMVAWFMDLRIRVHVVIPTTADEFSGLMRVTQGEPCSTDDWKEMERMVKTAVARHEGLIDVLVTGDGNRILKELAAEPDDVASCLPFDVEAAIEESRVEVWRQRVGTLPTPDV